MPATIWLCSAASRAQWTWRPSRVALALELFEVFVQPRHRVELDLRGQLAQRFPFGQRVASPVALGAHEPHRRVVPVGTLAVGEKLGGGSWMVHRITSEK